jgi:hypothetical protein
MGLRIGTEFSLRIPLVKVNRYCDTKVGIRFDSGVEMF